MSFIINLSEDQSALVEMLAKSIGDRLHKWYPGHLWAVNVRPEQGVVEVRNYLLSGHWGFIVKMNKIDPKMKIFMRLGGELLERYKLRAGRYVPGSTTHLDRMLDSNFLPETG